MKNKHWIIFILLAIALIASVVSANDGEMFRRNISKTPDQETERANLAHMTFYVPAQSSAGDLVSIVYTDTLGTVNETRDFAKPLIAVYIDGLLEEHEETPVNITSGAGYGAHDAYVAVSFDDGATWKRTNLSNTADLSSFILADGHSYPGDAHNMTFALAGDKVLVGWISKYCDGGSPAYTWDTDGDPLTDDPLYPDLWGVAGSQRSVDYTLQGFPEVGEIPYSCVWAARGTLLPISLDEETPETEEGYEIIWTKAERLTSGRRDANRLEMNGDSAAGFMMTWQEDPEGLRPGQGLGPGEGWSGAVVNQQTDLWYTYISMADFDLVDEDGDYTTVDAIPISEYAGEELPKVAVPMTLPVRLTDNRMCKTAKGIDNTESQQFPYCFADFSTDPPTLYETPSENSTFCASTVSWTTPKGTNLTLCKAQDGRVMQGRVGASRPRVNVQPYDSNNDGVYDNAWVIMGAEESKSLGEGSSDQDVEPEDIGKNMWYYSFDMLNPEVVMQGGMLNQPATCSYNDIIPHDETPAICPDGIIGELQPKLDDELLDVEFYPTEIARRFSHFSQPIHQIGENGVSAVLIIKQGVLNQGGPADIFLRRLVIPDDVWIDCETNGDPATTEQCLPLGYNPYAYENMVCEDDPENPNDGWTYTETTVDEETGLTRPVNPRYIKGLCLSNMINVSGTTIVSCEDGTSGVDCAEKFPWDGGVTPFPKVTEWRQCDETSELSGYTCTDNDLDDQSWENPYDVAKGHRGFIDGDFIMMMYAWSPNWKANSVGNDHYNLYVRRSFDGGETWTTTPASADYPCKDDEGVDANCDGTIVIENYCVGLDSDACTPTEFDYAVGAFEQARNVSQLTGNRVTVLDPRYTPTGGIKMLPITDKLAVGNGELPYADDAERDPSKFFVVYETGDNTTVAEGEAVPMDLFYSRAVNWGDDYDLVEYPTGDGDNSSDTYMGFDWLEHDRNTLSGEAANTASPGGGFYYAVWNQWQEDEHENVSESDALFRRIMYLDELAKETQPPNVSILYVSHTMADYDDTLVLIGSAKDGDHVGELPIEDIGDVLWTDTFNGVMTEIGHQKQVSIPANSLQLGWHKLTFSASDKGGHWADGVSVEVWIAEEFHHIYLPTVAQE